MASLATSIVAIITASHIFLLLSARQAPLPPFPDFRNECRELCKRHRPNGSTEAYMVKCYKMSEPESHICERACWDCHKFCLHALFLVEIKCPSSTLTDGQCKSRCDYQRPDDFLGEFSFNCRNETLFPTLWDRNQCSQDCNSCPIDICDLITEKFECPMVTVFPVRPPAPPPGPSYEGPCESRCEKNRPDRPASKEKGGNPFRPNNEDANYNDIDDSSGDDDDDNGDNYSFVCSEVYKERQEQLELCLEDCGKCPLEVCDPSLEDSDDSYEIGFARNDEKRKGFFECPNSKPTPSPGPAKPDKFTASWTVIAMIAVGVVGCIAATTFYGRSSCVVPRRCRKTDPEMQAQQSAQAAPEGAFENGRQGINEHVSLEKL